MNLKQALIIELGAIAGIHGKVHPLVAKAKEPAPYIIYRLTSSDRAQSLNTFGEITADEIELQIFHNSPYEYNDLKELVIAKIESMPLRQIATTGPYIQQIEVTDQFEEYDDTLSLYTGTISFYIYY